MQNGEKEGSRGTPWFRIIAGKEELQRELWAIRKAEENQGKFFKAGETNSIRYQRDIKQHKRWKFSTGLGTSRARWQNGHSNLKSEDPSLAFSSSLHRWDTGECLIILKKKISLFHLFHLRPQSSAPLMMEKIFMSLKSETTMVSLHQIPTIHFLLLMNMVCLRVLDLKARKPGLI